MIIAAVVRLPRGNIIFQRTIFNNKNIYIHLILRYYTLLQIVCNKEQQNYVITIVFASLLSKQKSKIINLTKSRRGFTVSIE
jgi:hypothetical protein